MSILSFLDFVSFLVYAGLGIYILTKNPEAALNRLFFGIACCFAVWTFSAVFFDEPHSSPETAKLVLLIGSLGWLSFGSFVFPFFVFFTQKHRVIPLKKLLVFLIAVPVVLIYQQWQHESIISEYILQPYGWTFVWHQSVWTYLFFVYFSLTTGIGLLLVADYWKRTDNPAIKHQAAIIFTTGIFALGVGSLTNMILPVLRIYRMPDLGHLALLLWVCGIAYVMVRYQFLTLTPATAAENILSTMTEALILLNPNGKIITVNQATMDMLGFEKQNLEGRMFEDIFASKKDAGALLTDLNVKEGLSNEEFQFVSADEKKVPVFLSAGVLKDEWGQIVGIVCVARDISERIEIQKKMFALHKLESVQALAGGIAHEYNNKLSVLSCNIDLIRLKLADNKTVEKNLEPMKTAIAQISELTAQLLAYARGGKYQPGILDINEVVDTMPLALNDSGNDEIRIEKSSDKNLPRVMADFGQIQMVLHIILSNASEALSGKGRIQISVTDVVVSEEDARAHSGFVAGHYVRLTVKDDGRGMDEQTLKQIFDPFFSTKVHGRGLGMAAVYGIIKNHDGFIDVISQSEKGTSVYIYLPALEAEKQSQTEAERST